MSERGHDYFIQITDARPDTGGLSGATPAEAVSWGKIDPDLLPDTVVCYVDSTIAMPLIASYVLAKCKPRKPRRLYKRLNEMEKPCAPSTSSPISTPATGPPIRGGARPMPATRAWLSGKPRRRTRR